MRAVICLPTYNERENLGRRCGLSGACSETRNRVLVVDDASPDGTGAEADPLAGELPYVEVLHRHAKDGLEAAYLAAFRRARPRLH